MHCASWPCAARPTVLMRRCARSTARTSPSAVSGKHGERLVACIGPGPESATLVRSAARLASSLKADWLAVYVETPKLQRLPDQWRKTHARCTQACVRTRRRNRHARRYRRRYDACGLRPDAQCLEARGGCLGCPGLAASLRFVGSGGAGAVRGRHRPSRWWVSARRNTGANAWEAHRRSPRSATKPGHAPTRIFMRWRSAWELPVSRARLPIVSISRIS